MKRAGSAVTLNSRATSSNDAPASSLARAELESQLRRDRATDRFGETQERLQSKLEQPGADLNELAKEFNLQTGEVAQFVRGAGGAPLGAAQPLQDMVFGDSPLSVGRLGGPLLLGDDRLVVVKVLEHRKPQVKPLAEVRDGIVEIGRASCRERV